MNIHQFNRSCVGSPEAVSSSRMQPLSTWCRLQHESVFKVTAEIKMFKACHKNHFDLCRWFLLHSCTLGKFIRSSPGPTLWRLKVGWGCFEGVPTLATNWNHWALERVSGVFSFDDDDDDDNEYDFDVQVILLTNHPTGLCFSNRGIVFIFSLVTCH